MGFWVAGQLFSAKLFRQKKRKDRLNAKSLPKRKSKEEKTEETLEKPAKNAKRKDKSAKTRPFSANTKNEFDVKMLTQRGPGPGRKGVEKKMKKIAAMLLAVLLLVGAVACTPAEPAETPVGPSPSAQPEQEGSGAGEEQAAVAFVPGTYTGTAGGNNGPITVEVTVSEDRIESIEIGDNDESFFVCEEPFEKIPQQIIEYQTLSVDLVSGATFTSRGVLAAVENALEQTGADLAALEREIPVEQGDETLDCEVAVVGAGIAGLCAAARLKELGVDVVLIEKLDIAGGSARFSGGDITCAVTEDDYDAVLNKWLTNSDIGLDHPAEYPNMDKLTRVLRESTATVNWFTDAMGIEFDLADDINTYIHARAPEGKKSGNNNGFYIVDGILNYYESLGGEIRYATKAESLIQEADGRITGVNAVTDGGSLTIHAKAVIMTTGSYTHNQEMLEEYMPQKVGETYATTIGATGEGMQMCLDAGGVLYDAPFSAGAYNSINPQDILRTTDGQLVTADSSTAALFVSFSGTRNVSETGRIINFYENLDGPDGFYGIYDAELVEELGRTAEYDGLASAEGPYYKADSLEELAAQLGVDEAVFLETVERYNGFCEAGTDEEFGKSPDLLNAIDAGPFYAVRYIFVNNDLVHGVRTSLDGEVLREDGSAIPGLYAAGYISMRDFYASGNLGGACLSACTTMGRLTAEAVAEAIQ